MSAPPEDLMQWPKAKLARELGRLRAVLREHAEQVAPAHSGGGIVDVAGDPHAAGGALIDARGAVLLDSAEVVLIDLFEQRPGARASMALRLAGRINYGEERADTTYLLGPDGAAAIVSEVRGLVLRAVESGDDHGRRFASEFHQLLQQRMVHQLRQQRAEDLP